MIDTIVLTLRQGMFTILQHDYFSPSTEGLYKSSDYYRLGGRSNMVCKQNPTPSELKNGIYKPRLTVTKRINRQHQFEITMKIEFSVPKLLYGNNFDELEEAKRDFRWIDFEGYHAHYIDGDLLLGKGNYGNCNDCKRRKAFSEPENRDGAEEK